MQCLEAEIKGDPTKDLQLKINRHGFAHNGKVMTCSCGQMPETRIISS